MTMAIIVKKQAKPSTYVHWRSSSVRLSLCLSQTLLRVNFVNNVMDCQADCVHSTARSPLAYTRGVWTMDLTIGNLDPPRRCKRGGGNFVPKKCCGGQAVVSSGTSHALTLLAGSHLNRAVIGAGAVATEAEAKKLKYTVGCPPLTASYRYASFCENFADASLL